MRQPSTILLSRSCDSREDRREFEDALAARLVGAGRDVLVVPHVYYLAASHPAVVRLASIERPLVVAAWLHPRATRWILRAHGIAEDALIQCLDLRDSSSIDDGLDKLTTAGRPAADVDTKGRPGRLEEITDPAPERWYPVMDYSRCVACKQCFGFCLFGVYAVDDDRVVAAQPDNCKNGCPACARVCPHGAIIFPHCDDAAIAGAPGMEITRHPGALEAVLQRARRKRGAAGKADAGDIDGSPNDDLDSLIDALEELDE